jgi:thiamine biosynthesis lipoprotein
MGTFMELALSTETGSEEALASGALTEAFELAERLERVFSFFDPGSELSRLNSRPAGEWAKLSPELGEVMLLGARVERASAAAFRLMPACRHGAGACYELGSDRRARRLSAGCVFDLGGIAKGYVVDRVFELLDSMPGAESVSVNAGGDLRVRGSALGEVEIRVPAVNGPGVAYRMELPSSGGAIATSSLLGEHVGVGHASARYAEPGTAAATTTVIAASCAVADALTKAACFGGKGIAVELEREFDARVLFFGQDGAPLASGRATAS